MALQAYLVDHPNPDFVSSVINGLQNGFWPWADTSNVSLPTTLDVKEYLSDPHYIEFANTQREIEIKKGRFSETFSSLLPGMLAVPVNVVPKPHSTKLRLVVNHSDEPFSRNSFINKSDVSVPLDGMQSLGQALREFRKKHGNVPLVLFKSDVSEAYRLCPMSVHWQMMQVIKVDGKFNVDRCNNFGSRAGGGIWGSVFALVLWIAKVKLAILDLLGYVDDAFSFELASAISWYAPHSTFYPEKQAKLLRLWDELGIPHSPDKQVSGSSLTIIGFHVDANAMTITMPQESKDKLIAAIREFAVLGRRPTLADYQALAGWVNWALNVYPLLRPSLCALYKKMAGKTKSFAEIYVNKAVCQELLWAANHLTSCDGVYFISSTDWSAEDADMLLLTDACLFGMGFWSPHLLLAFQTRINTAISRPIFYWEAYTVVSALHWALHSSSPPPRRVLIYCDNMNTVNLFSSLRALPQYNPLILTACDMMIRFGCQLRVAHISGAQNGVADSLSRFDNPTALSQVPNLSVLPFTPPQLMLGAEL